ncbi:hypothetical protein PENTCL1PPCAC_28420 [Pristionchus entomophagus]|uniref:Uncharacterized protein n=1 Tax=Pristionchus entomophagus TaxID=358040 RepID=A0AAV5UIF5_9BILA|nr:hypothetical protein PENTCL1PPCAC_28420 [Pristionchus entomophagus]
MRSLLPILLLLPASFSQQSRAFPGPNNSVELPQCPNGESPKLDKRGSLIQCLPGAGQHSVCGPVHTCFFSGMNYMCCPTNEPPADAPPVCPNGLMTVTDARNHVVQCIPGRKACPAGGQLCLHTGREREHVCCQKFLARPSTPRPVDSGDDEVVQKVSCPAKSLAVLNAGGNTIACSASAPCAGANHICFGTTKRAICCQEQAKKHLSLAQGVSMVDHTSGHHASNAVEKAVKETVKEGLKRKQIKESGKVDKRQEFLEAVQPSSPVQPLNDGEMTQKPVRRVKKVRKTTTTSTTTTTTTASPEEYEYYYVDENGKEETTTPVPTTTTTTTEAPTTTTRRIRRRKIKTTTASSEGETETETVTEAASEAAEQKEDKSYESGETIFNNRPRPQEIDVNAITEPQFAHPARARAAKTLTGPVQANPEGGRKQLAQKFIMRHIRNGWPYNENYYRPDVTEAPEGQVFVQ